MLKQGCAMLFPFVTFSYASRILGVEQLGGVSFAQSVISYFSLIAALGIKEYAVREGTFIRSRKEELNRFVNEIFSINVLFTLIAYLLLGILLLVDRDLLEYRSEIFLFSLSIVLTTLGTEWINTIYEDFFYLTVRYVIIGMVSLALLFLFVKTADDLYKYILITLFSSYGGNMINMYYLRKKLKVCFTWKLNLKKHIRPLSVLFSNSIASVIYLNSDITLIGIFLNDMQVGRYSAVTKIYTMVKTLINALVMAAIPRVSNILAEKGAESYRNILSNIFNLIFVMTVPVALGIVLKAENVIYLIFGQQYVSGEPALKILGIAIPFAVYAYLFSCVVLIPNKSEQKYMYSTMAGACINIVLNFFFIPRYGIVGAAVTTLVAECVVCMMCCHYARRFLRLSLDRGLAAVVGAGSVAICGVCILTDLLIEHLIFNFLVSVFTSGVLYGTFICVYIRRKQGKKSGQKHI